MVVDDQRTAILQCNGVDAAVGVGQVGGGGWGPGFAAVFGPALIDEFLAAAAEELEFVAMDQDCGLNEARGLRVVEGIGFIPGADIPFGSEEFHVDLPAVVFGAGGAQDNAVFEQYRFVLNGAEEALWKADFLGPGRAAIIGGFGHSPPGIGIRAHFVEQDERAIGLLKQDGVPAREGLSVRAFAGGHLDRS